MYEASSLQVAAVIVVVLAVCALAAWVQERERAAARQPTKRHGSLFAWQYSAMFATAWAVNQATGRAGLDEIEMDDLRRAARHIRGRVGVGEIIDPTPKGEALLVLATVQWCDEYAQANGVRA